MSLFQVTMMGVGMMIGAGVFVATGIGIGIAGPGGILLAFALNGFIAFLSVMTYAELGSALPKAGGGYSYVQESTGGLPGFITGWISWFGHAVAGSLYAITFAKYTLHFLSGFHYFNERGIDLQSYERIVAVAMAVLFIIINYRGAKETGKTGAVIAIGQTVVLLLIGIGGLVAGLLSPERMTNFTPFMTAGWGKVFVVMGFSLIGFEGYEVISHTAEEVVDAKKNVPKGIFYAVIIVVTTYLFVAFAAIVGGGQRGVSITEWFFQRGATGFAEAIGQLFPFGGVLAVFAAIFASTSALNATIYSSTRISFALGRDGHLPKMFEHISRKTRIPDVALVFSGIIIILVAAVFDVETVMAGASIFFIFLFNIVTFSGMKIRIERGHELEYGYLIPFFPVVPILSILGRTLIGIFLLDMAVWAYIIAGIWLLLGVLFFYINPRKKRDSSKLMESITTVVSEEAENQKQVLVALSNSETVPVLLKYGQIFAESQDSGLTMATIVKVPYQTPIEIAAEFTGEAEEILRNGRELLSTAVPVTQYLRYAHNTAEGLIQTIKSRNAKLLIMGWRGASPHNYFRMGNTLDPVIEKGSCDLVVIKAGNGDLTRPIKKILCPTKGKGPHGKLAWDLVKQLTSVFDAEVTIMHVTPNDKKGTIPEQLRENVSLEYEGMKYNVKIMQSSDPVTRIQEESKGYDLVVIGSSETSVFQRILFGSRPRRIAESCECSIMMVRKNTGLRSWFKRWFV